jgi:hypothetical protein
MVIGAKCSSFACGTLFIVNQDKKPKVRIAKKK